MRRFFFLFDTIKISFGIKIAPSTLINLILIKSFNRKLDQNKVEDKLTISLDCNKKKLRASILIKLDTIFKSYIETIVE